MLAGENPTVGVVLPSLSQFPAAAAIVFVGILPSVGDNLFEFFECLVNQRLHHLFFLRQDFVLILLAAEHILESAALEHLRPHSHFVQQAPVIVTVHDNPDAAGDRQFVGYDPLAGRRNVITARGRQTTHRGHHRLLVVLLKISNRTVDFIRGQNLATRRIHFQHDGFHGIILTRQAQLVRNQLHQVMAVAIPRFAADQPADIQDGHFVFRMVVLEGHLLQMLARLPP